MTLFDPEQNIMLEVIGLIFLLVGSGKWLFDLFVLDSVGRWWVYLVMIIVGLALAGYMKIAKLLIGMKSGPKLLK